MNSDLEDAPEIVFRMWRVRERVEWEAADQFARLAHDLRALHGPKDDIARMAEEAAADERTHAALCRAILDRSGAPLDAAAPVTGTLLGPPALDSSERALYACVALSCITETLSTALLADMQKKASPGIIHRTVHEILEDEVSHSRLGWAQLARAADRGNVSWLSRHVPSMLREAIASDVGPMLRASEAGIDFSCWGILPPHRAKEIVSRTVKEVILPGLERFGIATTTAEAYTSRLAQSA